MSENQVSEGKLSDAASNFMKEAQENLDRFISQRKDIENKWIVYDYMLKCAQNRAIASEEKAEVGTNTDEDEMSNTGSTLFHRQVKQLASIGASVQMSSERPFKYVPISNPDVFYSEEEAKGQANQHNIMARWTMKKDRFNQKSITFWHQVYKYGNIPVGVFWNKAVKKIKIFEPTYAIVPQQNGGMTPVETGRKETWKEILVDNYPSLKIYSPECVYADSTIGNIPSQNCVIVESLMNKQEIYEFAKTGEFDVNIVMNDLDERYEWDGSNSQNVRKSRKDNSGISSITESDTGMYLVRDIFMRCAITDDKWDEKAPPEVYWGTVIGNSISEGLIVRLEKNRDPDGEIPIEMIHAFPDDEDMLYHVAPGDIVRSDYSVESTVKNQAIDNVTLVHRPPLLAVEGMHRISDFTFRPNAVWPVDNLDAVKEFTVRDTTQITVPFLEYIRNDAQSALGTDKPFMGESFGARTSALEASNIYRNSLQPHLICVRYILEQYLYFYARKIKSYWQAFAAPGQVLAITDEEEAPAVTAKNLFGEFDIEIDIVDDFEDDVVTQRNINETLKVIGMVPDFAKRVNMENLLRKWFEIYHMNPAEMINPPIEGDSRVMARNENITMMQIGKMVNLIDGENSSVHLAEHEAERLRYNGIEEQYPNTQLLDQHIEQTKMAVKQQQASYQTMPTGNMSKGAGEMAGNEIAAAMGAQRGG